MDELGSLWQALEDLPTLAAVEAEWRYRIGDVFDGIKSLLTPKRDLADSFPNVETGYPYSVVIHSDRSIVGVCPETHQTIPLSRAQLIVLECRPTSVAERLCHVWGLAPSKSKTGNHRDSIVPIGQRPQGNVPPCFLVIPHCETDVETVLQRLIAEREAPFVLFVPTNRLIPQTSRVLARHHQCELVSLQETLSINAAGEFVANSPLEHLLGHKTSSQSDHASKNEFRKNGNAWTVTFAGQTHSEKDLVGMWYIAILLRNKRVPFHTSKLVSIVSGKEEEHAIAGEDLIDRQQQFETEQEYQDTLKEYKDAQSRQNLPEQERLRIELDRYVEARRGTTGIGKRRRQFSSPTSNKRSGVKTAIDRAIGQLKNRALANHLEHYLDTGHFLTYVPNTDIDWIA